MHPDDPRACVVSAGAALPQPEPAPGDRGGPRGARSHDHRPAAVVLHRAGRCPVIVGNVLVYRDPSHITATYARMLAPLLAPHLR